jgi:hypothetical protein
VIEDRFVARPAWEAAGAQLVADVAPSDDKLRRRSHSTLATWASSQATGYARHRRTCFATLIGLIGERDHHLPAVLPMSAAGVLSAASRVPLALPPHAAIAMDGSQNCRSGY